MRQQTRLAVGVVLALCAATGTAYAAVHLACARVERIVAARALAESAKVISAVEGAHVATLDATVTRLLSDPAVVAAFERRDRDRLAAIVRPTFVDLSANHGISQLNFLLPDASVFLRAQRSRDFGDVARRPVVAEAARTGEVAVGKDLGRTGFALRLVRPVGRGAAARIGFLEIGARTSGFLDRMKALTGDDYALVVGKRFLDRAEWAALCDAEGMRDGWEDLPAVVVVDATYADAEPLRGWSGDFATLPPAGRLLDDGGERAQGLATGILPMWNASGERVGGLVVRHDAGAEKAAIDEARRTLALTFAAVVLVASLAVLSLARSRPDSAVDPRP
jgi:hypothetical protein